MNNNIKDIIDKVEEENSSRAQLEQTIQFLKEEIKRLKFTIKEQRTIIEEQEKKILKQEKVPDDINVLKDIIHKQRKELEIKEVKLNNSSKERQKQQTELREKNSKLENLRDQINYLENKIQELKSEASNKVNKQNLENAQKIIEELTETNSEYSAEIDALKSQISDLEENSLQQQLTNQLSEANNKIFQLENRNEDLNAQINYLQKEIDKVNEKSYYGSQNEIQSYNDKLEYLEEELERSRKKIISLEKRNNELEEINSDLQKRLDQSTSRDKDFKQKSIHGFKRDNKISNHYSQIFLIERMFNLMNNANKEKIIASLIDDLYHSSPDVRTFAVNILAHIQTKDIFNALKELKDDESWIVRYYVAKALSNFKNINGLKEIMEEFLDDEDVDVREIALSSIKKL